MILAKWSTSFGEKALSFKILFAHSAVEALAVVVVSQSFDPSVTGLDGEAARKTFSSKKLVPIVLAVRESIFQEEGTVSEQLSAVRTAETFGMEVLSNRIQTIPFDLLVALIAGGCQELFETELAIKAGAFLDKADILQRSLALHVGAHKVLWTPDLAQGGDERSPNLTVAAATKRDARARCNTSVEGATTTAGCRRPCKSGALVAS